MKYISILMAAVLLASLTACSTINTKIGGLLNLDTDLGLSLNADADINPDDHNVPSPLYIRMYELKTDKQFRKADFIDLFERDKEVLGADLIGKQRLKRLLPGEHREKDFVLDPNTRFVGLYAEFQHYRHSTFKIILPVEPTNVVATSASVHISGNTMSASE